MARKILKTAIVLALLAGLGILGYNIGYKWYDKKYGEIDHSKLTDNLTVVEYNNGEIGILNKLTGKVVGRYNKVLRTFLPEESTHSTRIVVKDNLRGYISAQTGEVIFEPQFLYAWIDDPESGLAACVDKDHKLGFINVQTKKIAIPFQYDFNDDLFSPYSYYMEEKIPILDFVFSNGICIVPGKDGKIGMIDKDGKTLLPAKYSDIINWRDANTPNIILKRKPFFVGIGIVSEYSDGYVKINEIIQDSPASQQGNLKTNDIILKVKQENEKDYRDVFNMAYEDVLNLIRGENNTKVTLFVKHENGSTQDITIVRDEIIEEYSDYEYIYGVCDRNFKMIEPFVYTSFEKNTDYDDKYDIYVKNYVVAKDGKYGILDTLFNVVLPMKFDNIEVRNNSYIVTLNEKQGVLGCNFKTILPVDYDWISAQHIGGDYDNYKYIAKKDHIQKLYDEKGAVINDFYIEEGENVFEPVFDPGETRLSSYIKYYLDDYYGIIGDAKRVVIPAKYDKIEYLGNGNFVCTEGNYSFIIKDKK